MVNKIGEFLRKIHRHLNPVFVIMTIWLILVNRNPQLGSVLGKFQKVPVMTLAATGGFLFSQILYNK